ncbi:MAG TPA: hypothetical protein VNS79_04030 [Sphingobium sp.]|nr:hypothetical protein [Sphingobium sp.]
MIRRDVLKFGGVATAGLLVAGPLAAVDLRKDRRLALIDARFAEARAFGAAARASGARVVATDQDILSLWHGALRGTSLAGLTGLTTYADMIVIAGLAAEARRPFALRIAHQRHAGRVTHDVVDGASGCLPVLAAAADQWPVGAWTILTGAMAAPALAAAPMRKPFTQGGALWSWGIA